MNFSKVTFQVIGEFKWRHFIQTSVSRSFYFYLFIFFDWDSLYARLNSHYEAWSYKNGSTKKITGYRKSVQKEPTVKRCLLILDLKPLRSQVKGKHSISREFQSLVVRGKKLRKTKVLDCRTWMTWTALQDLDELTTLFSDDSM